MESGDAAGSPDADLAAEQDSEADSSENINPTGKYENGFSPGLDFAISDLVSLDSQAEVDQGIFIREGIHSEINVKLQLFSLRCVKIPKLDTALPESLFFFPFTC